MVASRLSSNDGSLKTTIVSAWGGRGLAGVHGDSFHEVCRVWVVSSSGWTVVEEEQWLACIAFVLALTLTPSQAGPERLLTDDAAAQTCVGACLADSSLQPPTAGRHWRWP